MPEWISKYWLQWLFGLVAAGLAAAVKLLSAKVKQTQKENAALREGMRAILRDRLTQCHDFYMDKGILPMSARENVISMYDAYHALGGNGAVTSLVEELKKLPNGTNNAIL